MLHVVPREEPGGAALPASVIAYWKTTTFLFFSPFFGKSENPFWISFG